MTESTPDTDALLDRWDDRLNRSQVTVSLPAEREDAPRMTWVHVGSSDTETNRRFLAKTLGELDAEFLSWLSDPLAAPAFWSESGHRGVRLPFELGPRSWGAGEDIPEDLGDRVPLIKIAVANGGVVTSLGLFEDVAYELPASLVPHWAPRLDDWSLKGPVTFAHSLVLELLGDVAWHHTAIQTFAREDWHADRAHERMELTIVTEAHLAELRVQRDLVVDGEKWFARQADDTVDRINGTLDLCFERLRNARQLARDEIQLAILAGIHDLTILESRQRETREREARATDALTTRITVLSALFVPATLVVGLLGANWAQDPMPGGWLGLGLTAALTAVAALAAWALVNRFTSATRADERSQPPAGS